MPIDRKRERALFARVIEILSRYDLPALSPGDPDGAPADEYFDEARAIESVLVNRGSIEFADIRRVWAKQFSDNLAGFSRGAADALVRELNSARDVLDTGEDLNADLHRLVDDYGWAVRHVLETPGFDGAAFSYPIGLTAMDHPEIVVTGLPPQVAQAFLNMVGAIVKEGRTVAGGWQTDEFTESGDVLFIEATNTSGLTAVADLYGTVRALQLVWPDSAGRYPWQAGYNNTALVQPLLGPVSA